MRRRIFQIQNHGALALIYSLGLLVLLRSFKSAPPRISTLQFKLDMFDRGFEGYNLTVHENHPNHLIPERCNPPLAEGRFFSDDFVSRLKRLTPVTFAEAINGAASIDTWLTVSANLPAASARGDPDRHMLRRARMASRTLDSFCKHQVLFQSDHVPQGGCPGDAGSLSTHFAPTYSGPWCFPPQDSIHIMSVDCGILDNFLSHPDVAFTLFTEDGVMSTDRGRWIARSDVPVTEYDEIAIMGAAEYPTAPGGLHESLRRLDQRGGRREWY